MAGLEQRAVLAVALLSAVTLSRGAHAMPAQHAAGEEIWARCWDAAQVIEREDKLPALMLTALTMTESGRSAPDGALTAWPWTVHAQGRGYYFASKEAAIDKVRRLRASGVRTIDVGCAQINLRYHPDAFASLDEAFDPVANVSYASKLLRELRARSGSWEAAIARYHSFNPLRQLAYKRRVLAAKQRVEREVAAFWKKSDVHAAPSDAPGNHLMLSSAEPESPELAARSGRQAWTRWHTLFSHSRALIALSAWALPPDWPKRDAPAPEETAPALGLPPRLKALFGTLWGGGDA